ncbi:MAG: preprotein translocase subunit SecA [Clostridiaceae bacterium]|nr:preprotein translocase subunit SecA [Clostridiaceae bacterium]
MKLLEKIFGTYSEREIKRIKPIVDQVLALSDEYKRLTDDELKAKTPYFKELIKNGKTLDEILPHAFATVIEASDRVLGMRHFPVQIMGGIVLHQGRIAEMKTGEGKTLVATLPAYLNALTGKGVHIVTVNDYLAKRDSEWMGKIYRFLGLSVGLIIHPLDNKERKKAYACDITYGTNNELGFDYLRDNMVIRKEDMVQRGFNFAIVDEVDSILIDEARTPLIISGAGDKSNDLYIIVDRFVRTLKPMKVVETDDKQHYDDVDADYIIDEKSRSVTLTERGIRKVEEAFNIENLSDPEHMTLAHHVNQALKAHGIMHKDVDYVVKDGEVIIVDEFTGRLMPGRRYSDGLHQAIEAKEGVKVARENKTLATITFQNFFRLYEKLSGMTGTALTEEEEFKAIYNLDVVEIPTNKPIIRVDYPDVIYKTERAKFEAVANQIEECYKKGQPVLVGTISIAKSEQLSAILKKRGIKHEVLNAKHHEKEAQIVAQAGKKGAVTIATNMAGRGTDIILGGNAELMAKNEMLKMGYSEEIINEASGYADTDDENILEARKVFQDLYKKFKAETDKEREEVVKLGGLFIIGTERHESRRIDNQLRGRAGRQGDIGYSRFYLSLEDDLMRLFGSDRISQIADRLGMDENEPLETNLLSKSIESAQAKVEARNFNIRKYVLNYDDVMNTQREVIYKQRQAVLNGENVKDSILKMIDDIIDTAIKSYCSSPNPEEWNMQGLINYCESIFLEKGSLQYTPEEIEDLKTQRLKDDLKQKALERYARQEEIFGENMREVERIILLRAVDTRWMDHIDDMEQLKQGIALRAYGQHDPVAEYKFAGYEMFEDMIHSIKEDTIKYILNARPAMEIKREQVLKPTIESHGDGTLERKPVVNKQKVGRNDPCPCGSGKKYKKCCGLKSNENE